MPYERSFNEEHPVVEEGIFTLKEAGKKVPKIKGVPTGIEGLDELFFTAVIEKGKPVKKPLGGIPKYGVFNITGIADTGKSLMVEQYTAKQASRDEKVAFITVESPAAFVAQSIKARAIAMGLPEEKVDENVILIDAASHRILREDMLSLLNTLAHVIKTYKVEHVVVDSITGLYEAKEMMARTIVRQLFNFLKKWHQTGLFVSQKRSGHELISAEAAGGYAVAHIVDGTMVLSKEIIDSQYAERMYGRPLGEVIRLFRIDGCRLSGHDTNTRLLKITETGLVIIGESLAELRARRSK